MTDEVTTTERAMFESVGKYPDLVAGEHEVLEWWQETKAFDQLRDKNRGRKPWSFLDGPITANNPMGVHHAWGRTFKDAFQRYFAMNGHELRYQNGFDCQGLWVEVEVEKEMGFTTKTAISSYGIEKFVRECKKRVLRFAARQTSQSIRLGYWMEWDDPDQLLKLAEAFGSAETVSITTPRGEQVSGTPEQLTAQLGNPQWGGSYFTFSTENNETIWAFLKKCHDRGKIYKGFDVMPWSGRGGSAYSQMEVADGRKLTVHRSVFLRLKLRDRADEYLLVWTTTPWTLTSNVAAAVNPDLDYVKVRSKRDGAAYYFAKENLEFPRLAREFKEGFGKAEWSWPRKVPKLSTIAQIFQERGGYEVEATLKGSDLVGWEYDGPFDELTAQQAAGGVPADEALGDRNGTSCHRVIDGGRDSKGSPNVVAGEGTGIVHIAPGCGDIDHQLGEEHGLVVIAPLGEDGCFGEEFGPFAGRSAIDPDTASLVFEQLKSKGLLVAVENYPHVYPHCWRTGDELVFRLVDEWFINMDWRGEIQNVTAQIDWLPAEIDGQNRELQWLSNMGDWMISKKRFWGLALPIWVDEQTEDFEVMGSLEELKQRAVEGWEQFEGHSPHRPWIDRVKIRNPKTGNLMSRIEDVGNPWLDAGIVPYSTLSYRHDRDYWSHWFPAQFITECFPGQFRNWFYALLAMSTMMENRPPFKSILGHGLVRDEDGKEMHKSTGNAIWFDEAVEKMSADVMRWIYCRQSPSHNLNFGYKIGKQVERKVFGTLWNTYALFCNYARLDEFEPGKVDIPLDQRAEIDRWVLSNLQLLIRSARGGFESFATSRVVKDAEEFIDQLSNWYVRRSRRRFWRSKDETDRDKKAAYQTLYEVLVTLCKLLAPVIPFVTERIHRNLVAGDKSIHLSPYPEVDESLMDERLSYQMGLVLDAVRCGHSLREQAQRRVRQPLGEIRIAATTKVREAIEPLQDYVLDELNVKTMKTVESLGEMTTITAKANFGVMGPKLGKHVKQVAEQLNAVEQEQLRVLQKGESIELSVDGATHLIEPDFVTLTEDTTEGWVVGSCTDMQVALCVQLTPELIREGVVRDFVRQVQQFRKDLDLNIEDRIRIQFECRDPVVNEAIGEWAEYIKTETLADELAAGSGLDDGREIRANNAAIRLIVARVD